MKRTLATLLALVFAFSALTACGSSASPSASSVPAAPISGTTAPSGDKIETTKENVTIAFLFEDLETEFWVASHKAITETLGEAGIKVLEFNCQGDANKQLEQTKDAITQQVDGMIMIPVDGDTAVSCTKEANAANIPIGIYNRPPTSDEGANITVVCDNKAGAEESVDYLVEQAALKFEKTGKKLTPLIIVGDLGDPNAVARKDGFYAAIAKNPDIFNKAIEVPSEWDAAVCLANLQSAVQATPDIDLLFTSSDFLFPTIQAVLEPMGKWVPNTDENHVLMAGYDGDATAGELIDEGIVDATGVQDVFYEAELMMAAIVKAINEDQTQPDEVLVDPGFALTQGNLAERKMEMWGNVVRLS